MLVRKFVGARLASYYAQAADVVVGATDVISNHRLPLSMLLGEWHWKRLYRKAYQQQRGHWLTPVELFKPYFSNCIAKFCIQTADNYVSSLKVPFVSGIHIVELGAGRGTNAKLVLDYIAAYRPDLYDMVKYTVIDSSPALHNLQKTLLSQSSRITIGNKNQQHAEKYRFILRDLMDVAEGKVQLIPSSDDSNNDELTIFLALEVFDNLPHDKIKVSPSKRVEQAEVKSTITHVAEVASLNASANGNTSFIEEFKPLSDSLLKQVLSINPHFAKQPICWVPTVACGLLQRIMQTRSPVSVLIADFDYLPPSDTTTYNNKKNANRSGLFIHNEPLISSLDGQDHPHYISAPPMCDILFPTNFSDLALFTETLCSMSDRDSIRNAKIQVYKQGEFLLQIAPEEVRATTSWLSGYSPLIDDFYNCSVFTAVSK